MTHSASHRNADGGRRLHRVASIARASPRLHARARARSSLRQAKGPTKPSGIVTDAAGIPIPLRPQRAVRSSGEARHAVPTHE